MIGELPPGWEKASVGTLIELKYGKALPQPDRSGDGYPVFGSNGVVGAHARALSRGTTIVIGRKGSVGEVHFSVSACSPIDTTYFVDDVPGRQFRFWFRALQSLDLASLNKSTAIPGLSRSDVYRLAVPVPPLAEQQRIADKLDTVLARVDACRDRLARVAPLLKRFRQSVLAAASSGQLTGDWPDSEHSVWASVTVESLCASISDGPFGSHLKSDDYVQQGARVVRLENIDHLTFDKSKETFVSMQKFASLERHALYEGDLLFSSFVDEEVRVCKFPGDLGAPAINKADCFCLRVNPTVCDPAFLMYRLACKTTYLSLKEQVHGATRPRINLGQLRRFKLLLPSRAEQSEIVRRVETLFAFADRMKARLAHAQTAVDRLTPSLLSKAFRGELVPRDSADEPAAELLKRLAAIGTGPTGKTRKSRQAQAA